MSEAVNTEDPRLEELHRILAENSLAGHWQPRQPSPELRAHLWRWPVIYSCLMESGEVVKLGHIDEAAKRRTVQLVNPGLHRVQVHHPHHPDVGAAREAGGARRVPPPHGRGPALRGGGRRRRLHHGGRRGDAHGARRPGADAELDLARPLQPGREQHRVARRPGRAPDEPPGRQLPRELRRGTRPSRSPSPRATAATAWARCGRSPRAPATAPCPTPTSGATRCRCWSNWRSPRTATPTTACCCNTPTPSPAAPPCPPSTAACSCCAPAKRPGLTATPAAPSTTSCKAPAPPWRAATGTTALPWPGPNRTASWCHRGTGTTSATTPGTEPAILFSVTDRPVLESLNLYSEED